MLQVNVTTLGPLVLPISEQILFLVNLVMRKLQGSKKIKPYIPDFKLAFDRVSTWGGVGEGGSTCTVLRKAVNWPSTSLCTSVRPRVHTETHTLTHSPLFPPGVHPHWRPCCD